MPGANADRRRPDVEGKDPQSGAAVNVVELVLEVDDVNMDYPVDLGH